MINTVNTNNDEYKKTILITAVITLGGVWTTLFLLSDKIMECIYPSELEEEINPVIFDDIEETYEKVSTEDFDIDKIISDLEKETVEIEEIIKQEYKDSNILEALIVFDDEESMSESSSELNFDPEEYVDGYVNVGYISV